MEESLDVPGSWTVGGISLALINWDRAAKRFVSQHFTFFPLPQIMMVSHEGLAVLSLRSEQKPWDKLLKAFESLH